MSIKILVADDHRIVRQGLCSLLCEHNGMEVVGEASDGDSAIRLARDLAPDLVIMDISMPGVNGIEATRQIKTEAPAVRIIALSMHLERQYVSETLKAGASGYLSKDSPFEELFQAIKSVMDNKVYLSPGIAGVVIEDYFQLKNRSYYNPPRMPAGSGG